ncbi:uncharacterized protein LOC106653089 [Trichogramma pretiosum]|uniref:Uncharacterized protein n=1 Tax=Trichogramma kaykai TaxID=54128 RepID=A0ABD2WEE8_9HYME|nr:uncharacterized protein LOC106653089 [Trichogramma pretiosum]
MISRVRIIGCIVFVLGLTCATTTSAVGSSRESSTAVQAKETNSFDFVRLLIMRMIYGIASMMGYGEQVSEFFGGILVPPGAEDQEDDFDFLPDFF